MRRTGAHPGVRMIEFYEAAEYGQLEAAESPGAGERSFRRWRQRHEDEGEAGLPDRHGVRQAGAGDLTDPEPG